MQPRRSAGAGGRTELEGFLQEKGRHGFTVIEGEAVPRHLLELAAGIDSLIVGEDQILGQLKQALAIAEEAGGAANSVISLCVNKAVHVGGVRVRRQTQINRGGAVSVGSAAVTLAENLLGTLSDRHILVVGSGEMGVLVAQALAAKGLTAIYVANRTYERAVMLADKIGGGARSTSRTSTATSRSPMSSSPAPPHRIRSSGRRISGR